MTSKRPVTDKDKLRVVGEVSFVKCNICRQPYFPTTCDISLNANFYYKNCKPCRDNRVKLKEKSLLKRQIE